MNRNLVSALVLGGTLLWGAGMISQAYRLASHQVEFNNSNSDWNRDWRAEREAAEQALIKAKYDQKQIECLAQNVYHEARGEDDDGKIAVAAVTINRVNSRAWGGSVCSVVWEDSAFSWTLDRRLWRINERSAYNRARNVAEAVYRGEIRDPTRGATHYHTLNVNPYWSAKGTQKIRIGAHIFMRMAGGGR